MTELEAWRCPGCSRILARLALAPGSVVEVKCKSCGAFSVRETLAAPSSAPDDAMMRADGVQFIR